MGFLKHLRLRLRQIAVAGFGASLCVAATGAKAQTFAQHSFGNAIEALVITIDGPFEPGASERFRSWLETEPVEAFRVLLNSPGGSLLEGMRIGAILREYNFRTEVGAVGVPQNGGSAVSAMPENVPGQCVSACALAFLGGIQRAPGSAEFLGFHQFSGGINPDSLAAMSAEDIYTSALSGGQEISGLIISYMVSMGIDARVFAKASEARPDEMLTLSLAEALEYDVVTRDGFGAVRLLPAQDGILARSDRDGPTQPYDSATGLGFFCQRGQPGEGWILIETDMPGENHADFRAATLGAGLSGVMQGGGDFGFSVKPAKTLADGRGPNNTLRWLLRIGSAEIDALIAATELWVYVDVPRAYGGYSTSSLLTQQDRLMIRSSFLHCI